MSRESKGGALVTSVRPSSGVSVAVRREGLEIKAEFDVADLPKATNVMSADCGVAVLRYGQPEILLGQLHPFNEKKLVRLLAVRYPRDQFVARAKLNESFRTDTEKVISKGRDPGRFSRLLLDAKDSDPAAVRIDSEVESIVRTTQTAAITFLQISPWEIHMVASGKRDDLWLNAPIEVTMSVEVLADLLLSWKNIAQEVSDGRA